MDTIHGQTLSKEAGVLGRHSDPRELHGNFYFISKTHHDRLRNWPWLMDDRKCPRPLSLTTWEVECQRDALVWDGREFELGRERRM